MLSVGKSTLIQYLVPEFFWWNKRRIEQVRKLGKARVVRPVDRERAVTPFTPMRSTLLFLFFRRVLPPGFRPSQRWGDRGEARAKVPFLHNCGATAT
jgi:hypothetical protein